MIHRYKLRCFRVKQLQVFLFFVFFPFFIILTNQIVPPTPFKKTAAGSFTGTDHKPIFM